MNQDATERESLVLRTLVIFAMVAATAALRIAPHPWNFTPVGAIALFSGATIPNRRLAFLMPLLVLFVSDCFIGFHRLMPVVYFSFLISVGIGRFVARHRSTPRVALATTLGALQFFIITNFAVWEMGGTYPRTLTGLATCYFAGIPFFWNTLAGDIVYATVLFGGLAFAERFLPAIKSPAHQRAA
jgi:hypothetical protein